MRNLNRRQVLRGLGAVGAGAALGTPGWFRSRSARAQNVEPRFLIVLCGSGGANLIDSFLAIRASESANASSINAYPDDMVTAFDGSPLRAIDNPGSSLGALPIPYAANQSTFVRKHMNDIMVATHTGTSVNHAVAQKRSITGNEAWSGRTLQEIVALTHGEGLALPNVSMATGTNFIDRGTDDSLPDWAFGEPVASPAVWPLALHGTEGLKDVPRRTVVDLARTLRDDVLDPNAKFTRVFRNSPRLALWRRQRANQATLESADLVKKLLMVPDSAEFPLSEYGLQLSPDAARVRQMFPQLDSDKLQSQAALAFLLLKNRVSTTVTIGPSFNAELADGVEIGGGGGGFQVGDLINPPIAFDYSHQAHRATQAMMWSRLLNAADGLIDLLKAEELSDGVSMWDRTMIYVATEFGREKIRPNGAEEFGTSHHLNNGIVAISPMVRGNTVLGGVDPDTGLTYGFNPATGAPERGREMTEAEIFSGLLGVMGVDTSGTGLPSVPAMRRA